MREESMTQDGILEVGETWTYNYTYTVTADDVAAGSVLNRVAVSDPLNPDEPIEDEVTVHKPSYTVEKTSTTDRFYLEGDEIDYQIVVRNTGQVAIENLTVSDSLVTLTDDMREESLISDGILEVGETWIYRYTYVVTSADVAAGSVLNEVTVTDPLNPDEPVEGELSIVKPVHTVEKIALTDGFQREGDEIEYRIVVTNTGQVAINDLTVTDSLVTLTDAMREESLTSDGILEIGETWTYTYTYVVTTDDVKAGSVSNLVSVTDPMNPDEPVGDRVDLEIEPLPSMKIEKRATETSFKQAGDLIHYEIVLTNTGNVALHDLEVVDSLIDLSQVTAIESVDANDVLDIGETWTWRYVYRVEAADVANGKVVNRVEAKAKEIVDSIRVSLEILKTPDTVTPEKPGEVPKTGEMGGPTSVAWLILAAASALIVLKRKRDRYNRPA